MDNGVLFFVDDSVILLDMCYYYIRHAIRDIFIQFCLYSDDYLIGQVFSIVYMPKYQQPDGHYRKYTTSIIKLSKCILGNRYQNPLFLPQISCSP